MKIEITMPQFVKYAKDLFEDQIQTIFEVGSLDGRDAKFFKESFPEAQVFAIEGLPENFNNYLKDSSSITVVNRVISNYDGEVKFHKKNINGLHSIFDRGGYYGTETVQLPCSRLDTLCKELKIESIDMLKIDVEGATYEVLEGMGNLLDNVKIMHIETEGFLFFRGQKLHGQVSNFLISKGFEMLELSAVEIIPYHFQHDSVWRKK